MNKPASSYDADCINANYDCLVLPFANAFREDYIEKLQNYTNLIKKLTIPVVITGIGMQTKLDDINDASFPFDSEVTEFMSAVLERSASVGVRGEFTYDYLCRLGFKNYVEIIGCPSMYMFGDRLPDFPDKAEKKKFKVNINGKSGDAQEVKEYLFGTPCATFIPQVTKELRMVYCGKSADTAEDIYPVSLYNAEKSNVPMYFPVSVKAWFDLLQKSSMSIGTRIHGNIASVLAGVPSFIICTDSRTLELARYHEIPHSVQSEFDFNQSVYSLYENTDFTQVQKNHKKRYDNYISFLQKNGLQVQTSPFEDFYEKFDNIQWAAPVKPITSVGKNEMLRRVNLYYQYLEGKVSTLRTKVQTLSADLKNNASE